MTNYNLEEDALLKLQINLSIIFIFTIIISISLSYNSMMECEGKNKFYSNDDALNILRINRIIAFFVSLGFIYINIRDKNIKEKYKLNIEFADIQIIASIVTLIATTLVLYVAFSGSGEIVAGENPN